jgi:ubiquinone/menaquinone biosynthesis C-methylase UbiE
MTTDYPVDANYGRDDLLERILDALEVSGKRPEEITADDLSPVDQFHARGKPATLDLARRAGIASGMRILDVGGGLGGPARTLASRLGCAVEVLDLTEEFCHAGEALTALTGLSELVTFRRGDALNMPYPDENFDVVWTQHSSMNVPDKRRLYAEIQRVLRPGGRLALHEIMAGETSSLHFPVPWAREPRLSHLQPPESLRSLIRASGFSELSWVDETASVTEWFRQRSPASAPADPPPLGLHLLLGPDFGEMFHNQVRNLQEGRVTVLQAVFEKRMTRRLSGALPNKTASEAHVHVTSAPRGTADDNG